MVLLLHTTLGLTTLLLLLLRWSGLGCYTSNLKPDERGVKERERGERERVRERERERERVCTSFAVGSVGQTGCQFQEREIVVLGCPVLIVVGFLWKNGLRWYIFLSSRSCSIDRQSSKDELCMRFGSPFRGYVRKRQLVTLKVNQSHNWLHYVLELT
eukprot:sb/3473038/